MGESELNRIWRSAQKRIKNWFMNKEKAREKKMKKATPDEMKELEKLLKEAQEFTKENYFNLTARILRHTYCTGIFDAGVDEVSASKIMGHDVTIMREIYTHIQESRKKQTVVKIENLYKDSNIAEVKESK